MENHFVSVNTLYERRFAESWESYALSNYGGIDLTFRETAQLIEKLHIIYEKTGIQAGDKIAICGKNHAYWAVAFLSSLTYGAVTVPLLHEFKPANIHYLVNHSESEILFANESIWSELDAQEMPDLKLVIRISDFSVLFSRVDGIEQTVENLDNLFEQKYPNGLKASDLKWYKDEAEQLALINYTSGTSGFSKGVMLPYRSLWGNMYFGNFVHPEVGPGSTVLSMLPSAHMFGLMFEILFHLRQGAHVYFLARVPSPKIILSALADVKPHLVIAVPLIIEKVYKTNVKPILDKKNVALMRKLVPGFNQIFKSIVRKKLTEAFGGDIREVIIGGAALNKEVETFFHDIKFKFMVGYGMTECGPIITYAGWKKAKLFSAGYAAPYMELRIDSSDPVNVPGEIQVKGVNVFQGYYKNDEVTAESFTEDGWFRTGDMGVIDSDGYLFIRGRYKCMILGPNGQNIYPEEIETVLNNLPYVVESLVVENNGSLTAIIYPDINTAQKRGMDINELHSFVEKEVIANNKSLPNYAQIKTVEFLAEDFERTPKRSIKRYLYKK